MGIRCNQIMIIGALVLTVARAQADSPARPGRWQVVEYGLDLGSSLVGLELQTSPRGERPRVVPVIRDDNGVERTATASTPQPVSSGIGACRITWTEEGRAAELTVWPAPGPRLQGIVRLRDKLLAVPQTVRQVVLTPEVADSRWPDELFGRGRAEAVDAQLLDVVGADGEGLRTVARPVLHLSARVPDWSPNGRDLAFSAFDAAGRDPLIQVVPASGGTPVAVASGFGPRWSHDGSRIAYVASGKLDFATDWDRLGRNDERIESLLITGPKAGTVEVLAQGLWPRWSPNDDRLAYIGRAGTSWDLFVRSADGAQTTRLTDDLATDLYPCWTADGRSVMFLSDRGNRWDLYQIAADGREEPRRLAGIHRREDQADLGPDGSRVVFTDHLGGRDSQIMLLDLGKLTVRPLLDGAQGDRDPAWSPDGKSIAFVSRRPVPAGPRTTEH